jgi:hypothetical protein
LTSTKSHGTKTITKKRSRTGTNTSTGNSTTSSSLSSASTSANGSTTSSSSAAAAAGRISARAGPQSQKKQQKTTDPQSELDAKQGKGLRHFSMKVCRKVEEKGRTTYNEVADELVAEFMQVSTTVRIKV